MNKYGIVKNIFSFSAVSIVMVFGFFFSVNSSSAAPISATFLSGIENNGASFGKAWTTTTWVSTTPGATSVVVKIRSCDDSACSGEESTKDWDANCTSITSGANISTGGCVTNGDAYIQYQVVFNYDDVISDFPTFDQIIINYNFYPTSQTLTSSPYDASDTGTVISNLSWSEDTTPEGTDVKFQIRTAPDSTSSPDWINGSGWCGPSTCAATTGDTDYATDYYQTTPAGENINSNQNAANSDAIADQWVQYKVWLISNGAYTPILTQTSLLYMIASTATAPTASQATDGTGYITIQTIIDDIDDDDTLRLKIEYSLDGGSTYTNGDPILTSYITTSPDQATEPDIDNAQTYQVGMPTNNIITSAGANTVTIKWDTKSASNGTGAITYQDNVKLKITPYDGTEIGTPVISATAFIIDNTLPTNNGLSSLSADSSTQITITTQEATDAGVGLHSAPYLFNETTGGSGATDSTSYQTATTFIDTGLSINTQYTYKVKAKDAVGNESAYSSTLSKYTLSNIPTSLNLTSDSTTQITASWNANSNPAGTEYYIENTTQGTNSTWTTDTSWISSSLSCGTMYSFKVKSRNSDNTATAYASTISVETDGCGGGLISPTPPIIILPQNQTFVFEITKTTENEAAINLSNVKNAYQIAISTTPDFKHVSWELYEENITISNVNKIYIKFRSKTGGISEVIEVEINKDSESEAIPEGSLVKVEGDYKVYIKKQNYLRHIPNPTIFSFYVHFKWNEIVTITKKQFNNYQISTLVRELNDKKVYQINDTNLTKHHLNITTKQFVSSDRSWNMIYIINKQERDLYETGEDVTK